MTELWAVLTHILLSVTLLIDAVYSFMSGKILYPL